MDALRQSDIAIAQETTPSEKLAQALELMEAGIRLKRSALQNAHPAASQTEIEERLERWLLGDG